ncbi:arginine repressor [Ruminococcus sp. HUN007]|uniref:arginine repressor n=1 Tax=Ruminococcus sp. HUN007 TaxID=1514668 RepID=UPI0005D1BF38|nr:arginine repressor [Ruminococcus sp. HUN007]
MKNKRQKKILEIIAAKDVETQEELQLLLAEEGFRAAQPTVSRDIQELRLVKAVNDEGKYRYIQSGNTDARFSNLLLQTIISVDYAMNMVVIKCHTGMAQAACAMIDSMDYPQVLGTIAGDDTIFILLRNEENARQFMQKLKKMTG